VVSLLELVSDLSTGSKKGFGVLRKCGLVENIDLFLREQVDI
jgi:hypothetical protein